MADDIAQNTDSIDTVELATELTVAWLANPNNRVSADDVPAFLNTMHQTLTTLAGAGSASDQDEPAPSQNYTPAVSVRKSLASPEHILSMIDGKPYKTLRRHLATNGMTPDEYRERYGLRKDYPMVAQSYSESRRAMAKKIGLGRKPGPRAAAGGSDAKPARGRKTNG